MMVVLLTDLKVVGAGREFKKFAIELHDACELPSEISFIALLNRLCRRRDDLSR